MRKIQNNFSQFADCVEKKQYVIVNQKGEWYVPNRFVRFIRRLFCRDSNRMRQIVQVFSRELDKCNKDKISSSAGVTSQSIIDKYKNYIAAAEKISKATKSQLLESKKLSMQYRLGEVNGGLNKETVADEDLYKKLEPLAKAWKSKEFFFKSDEKELTDRDKSILKEFCRYKKFAELAYNEFLVKDSTLLIQLFKWSIRDKNSIDIFVQFNFLQEKISRSALSRRVGMAGQQVFGMKVDPLTGEKDVTLAFVKDDGQVEHVSLLDESKEVAFNSQYKISIRSMYQIFSDKRKDIVGNIEMFEKGIHNWNVSKIGKFNGISYDGVDTTQEKWWEKLPTYKTISIPQAKDIYGKHMDGVNWTVTAKSAIEKTIFDFEGNHGYMEVVIPVNGEYRVYPFGKFVEHFPTGTIAKLIFIFRTVQARIHYLDQNVYYGQRQTWGHHVPLTPAQGSEMMNHVAADIRQDEGSNSKFSFKKFNCSQWVESTIEKAYGKELPNLYKVPLKIVKPQNFLKHFFNAIIRIMSGNTHHPYKLVQQIKHKELKPIELK